MAFPLPIDLVNSSQGLLEGTAKWANELTYGTFWALLLFGFAVILGISSSRYGTWKAAGFGGFVLIVGSIFLMTMNLVSNWLGILLITLGAGAIGYMASVKSE